MLLMLLPVAANVYLLLEAMELPLPYHLLLHHHKTNSPCPTTHTCLTSLPFSRPIPAPPRPATTST